MALLEGGREGGGGRDRDREGREREREVGKGRKGRSEGLSDGGKEGGKETCIYKQLFTLLDDSPPTNPLLFSNS